MDKLSSMQAFVTVAELGSFSGAADALRISKAMTTKHIQQLEHELGLRLFSRSTRRLRLTDAGRALHREMGEAFHRHYERWVAAMTPQERSALLTGLPALVRVMREVR